MSAPRMAVFLPTLCLAILLPFFSGCADGTNLPRLLLKPSGTASAQEKSGLTINGIEKTAGYGVTF